MVLSDEEITRLFRIRKTVMQMLKDRGYVVGDFEIEMTKYQFIQKYGENMKREDLVINKGFRNSSDQVCYLKILPFSCFRNLGDFHQMLFDVFCNLWLQNLVAGYCVLMEMFCLLVFCCLILWK